MPGWKLGSLRGVLVCTVAASCAIPLTLAAQSTPQPDVTLTTKQTHDKFSRAIPPVARVSSGSVVEAFTHEATGGQLRLGSTAAEFEAVDMDRVHTLTGPVFVEEAEAGDILAVELLELEPGSWGWTGIGPDFGFLAEDVVGSRLKTFRIESGADRIRFAEGISLPVRPFAGVMGVAPDTDELLNTIPPRANGGNMDDPHLVAGTTVYLPVFVEGALFSIGDTHVVQGMGEVGGTAVESPMRIVYRLRVIKGRSIEEPQYEADGYYATTGFGTTLEEASRKATRFMVEHLMETRGLSWDDAYMLCSLVGDLKIAEVVDEPHMFVAMHLPKSIFD